MDRGQAAEQDLKQRYRTLNPEHVAQGMCEVLGFIPSYPTPSSPHPHKYPHSCTPPSISHKHTHSCKQKIMHRALPTPRNAACKNIIRLCPHLILHTYAHRCGFISLCVCVHGGQSSTSGVFLREHSPCVLRQDLSLGPTSC